jgi:gentisate 1,2-dioxygenase
MTASLQALRNADSLDALYPILSAHCMTAGWHKKRASLWKQPRTEFQPRHWSYALGRAALDQAGLWIGTELAERRNLLLFNPVGDNDYDTVRTLVAAYQMIKPGEYARPHRHTPNALRFVLDAHPGVFSVVDGVQLPMHTGDVLLTPSDCWHSHFNDSAHNAYWIDILDVPLVHLLEPMFFEEHPHSEQAVESCPESHPFWFKQAETLAALSAQPAVNGVQRHVLDAGAHFATQQLQCHQLAQGASTGVHRSTASRIFCVGQGRGQAKLGDLSIEWQRGDVLAVPSWVPFEIRATQASQLFEANDQPTLEKLGFYREART